MREDNGSNTLQWQPKTKRQLKKWGYLNILNPSIVSFYRRYNKKVDICAVLI